MGFYIRKSISAGPFRFNLSRSGLGLSVGVKGFRIGTGPRGNYVHMGRGGLYYRASIGGGRRVTPAIPRAPTVEPGPSADGLSTIESGDVLAMTPANGSDIVNQINQKMALATVWPWPAIGGALLAIIALGQPNGVPVGVAVFVLTALLCVVLAHWDKQRKIVVVMYDLDDEAIAPFRRFTEEFDKLSTVNRVWNIDAAGRTSDWKRNAGAGHLVKRQSVSIGYAAPRVVKTNVSIPSAIGGRQSLYFFPDVVMVVEGKRVGAVSYDQLGILWTTTIFIEDEGVPADAEVVGHTWRFVNKDGGPDRRFNNNRQIPQVRYLQMGFRSDGGLQKILQFSRVLDHSAFDMALNGLRSFVRMASAIPDASAKSSDTLPALVPATVPATAKAADARLKVFGAVAILGFLGVMFLTTLSPQKSTTTDVESDDTPMLQPKLPPTTTEVPSTDTPSLQHQLRTPTPAQQQQEAQPTIIDMRNEGYRDLLNHNYAQALRLFRKVADLGDAYGPFYLGYLYEMGWGVPRDMREALYWYSLSNQRGDPDAAAALIRLHAIPPR